MFERRPDMRKIKLHEERSINLALSDLGFLALQKVGLADEVKRIAIPIHARYTNLLNTSCLFQPICLQI